MENMDFKGLSGDKRYPINITDVLKQAYEQNPNVVSAAKIKQEDFDKEEEFNRYCENQKIPVNDDGVIAALDPKKVAPVLQLPQRHSDYDADLQLGWNPEQDKELIRRAQ
jgi:hypothetical protein